MKRYESYYMTKPPEQKISFPIKRCYESENFGHSIVLDRENFKLIGPFYRVFISYDLPSGSPSNP